MMKLQVSIRFSALGQDILHFTYHYYPCKMNESIYSPYICRKVEWKTGIMNIGLKKENGFKPFTFRLKIDLELCIAHDGSAEFTDTFTNNKLLIQILVLRH